MGIINSIKTLFYGFVMRFKLGLYSRKKRKRKKFARRILTEKLSSIKLEEKTVEKIAENYLNIGEIFLDRKNLRTLFNIHRISEKRKNASNV